MGCVESEESEDRAGAEARGPGELGARGVEGDDELDEGVEGGEVGEEAVEDRADEVSLGRALEGVFVPGEGDPDAAQGGALEDAGDRLLVNAEEPGDLAIRGVGEEAIGAAVPVVEGEEGPQALCVEGGAEVGVEVAEEVPEDVLAERGCGRAGDAGDVAPAEARGGVGRRGRDVADVEVRREGAVGAGEVEGEDAALVRGRAAGDPEEGVCAVTKGAGAAEGGEAGAIAARGRPAGVEGVDAGAGAAARGDRRDLVDGGDFVVLGVDAVGADEVVADERIVTNGDGGGAEVIDGDDRVEAEHVGRHRQREGGGVRGGEGDLESIAVEIAGGVEAGEVEEAELLGDGEELFKEAEALGGLLGPVEGGFVEADGASGAATEMAGRGAGGDDVDVGRGVGDPLEEGEGLRVLGVDEGADALGREDVLAGLGGELEGEDEAWADGGGVGACGADAGWDEVEVGDGAEATGGSVAGSGGDLGAARDADATPDSAGGGEGDDGHCRQRAEELGHQELGESMDQLGVGSVGAFLDAGCEEGEPFEEAFDVRVVAGPTELASDLREALAEGAADLAQVLQLGDVALGLIHGSPTMAAVLAMIAVSMAKGARRSRVRRTPAIEKRRVPGSAQGRRVTTRSSMRGSKRRQTSWICRSRRVTASGWWRAISL